MAATIVSLVIVAVGGYLWGSIPAGYWLGKILRGKDFDIRDYGSHKIGTTNVLRTLGKGPAALVFLLDISKGILPALITMLVSALTVGGWGTTVAAIAALLGHCFPVFIGFKGGRGVLTVGGALLVISPLAFLIVAVITIGTIAIFRYVSLGSIMGGAATIVCGLIFFFLGWVSLAALAFMIVAPGLVIFFHSDNIGRLLAGTERKLGQKEVVPSTKESSNVNLHA